MSYSIAVVGSTGLVGSTLLSILNERKFPIKEIYLIASQHSIGQKLRFQDHDIPVEDLATFDFHKTQLAFFCVGNHLAAQYVPIATAAGNIVIDKSSYYRNAPEIPLIIPEVNIDSLPLFKKRYIIASPNCNTIPIAVGLKPIYDVAGIRRINISTYQSVSGTGKDAVTELRDQTQQWAHAKPISSKVYSQQIAFNVLPHIDDFQENGYTLEEMKMVWEMRKIFGDEALAVNPTAVRVPVFCGHAAAVHIETCDKISIQETLRILQAFPSVKLMTGEFPYPTPLQDAAGKDEVYIGRVREDISHEKGINLWIVSDNLRKGAALNAVQIAEVLIKNYL